MTFQEEAQQFREALYRLAFAIIDPWRELLAKIWR